MKQMLMLITVEDEANFKKQTETTNRLGRLIHHDPTIVNENANKDSRVFQLSVI